MESDIGGVSTRVGPRVAVETVQTVAQLVGALVVIVFVYYLGRRLHLRISASIGMALAHGQDASQVLRDADSAMYAAKKAGRAQIRLAVPEACTP